MPLSTSFGVTANKAEMAALLLEAGAPVNGLPTSGETPLHGAASLGEVGVAEVWLTMGQTSKPSPTIRGYQTELHSISLFTSAWSESLTF